MTQEEKQLLLKDLCGRLPYGAIINVHDTYPCTILPYFNMCLNSFVSTLSFIEPIFKTKDRLIKRVLKEHAEYLEFRPFLRPMSSMTEEEKKEYALFYRAFSCSLYERESVERIDWLNAHHFDYRGLIEKGFALETPEGIYKDVYVDLADGKDKTVETTYDGNGNIVKQEIK